MPDKDEIQNAAAALYANGNLYFTADRYARNGDAQIGFWFFQDPVGLNANGTFSGVHSVGDILVLSDFTNGGAVSSVKVYKWVGTGGPINGTLEQIGSGSQCPPTSSNTQVPACATVNAASGVASIWPYDAKSGADNAYQAGAFYEGGIDLAAFGLAGECFSGFMAETRSSQSVDATLKDFVLGNFAVCGGQISITPDDTNEVGDPHTFTVTVQQTNLGVPGPATDGHVDVTLADSNGAVNDINEAASTCDDDGDNLDAAGQCTIVFTSPTAGKVTGHATATINVQGDEIIVETDGQGNNSGDAVKTFVDANIAIAASATNEVGKPHTFTVTVKRNLGDGAGFVAAPTGDVDFTLADANGADSVVDTAASTCDNAGNNLNASGQCTIVFSSPAAGQVVGNASVALTVGGVALERDTDPATAEIGTGPGGSGPATKTFVDSNITIAADATNEVGKPHTFTVTVKQNLGGGAGFVPAPTGLVTHSLVNQYGAGAVLNAASSTCDDPGPDNLAANGTCTVVFTSPTAGQVIGNASVTLTVGGQTLTRDTDPATATVPAGPDGSGPATKTFVDANIAITGNGTNAVGQPHTFTVTVQQNLGGGSFGPANSGHVVVALTDTNGAVNEINADDSTCDDAGDNLNDSGQCVLVFSSDTAGTVTGHATVDLTVGTVTLTRSTSGNAGAGGSNDPAVKTFVDANIAITGNGTNAVGEPHTFTVTVKQNPGTGLVAASIGHVTFTLTDGGAAVNEINADASTCDDAGPDNLAPNGTCTIVFSSDTAGTVTGHASVTLSVGGVQLTRSTSGNAGAGGSNDPAVKTFVNARISIEEDATNEVNDEHTFTVTVEADFGSGLAALATQVVDVAVDPAPNGGITANTCATGTDANGKCQFTIESSVAGTFTANASTTVEFPGGVEIFVATDGNGGTGPAVKTFVDAKISISPDATNAVTEPHTFLVNFLQDDGLAADDPDGDGEDGFGPVPDGTLVTVTLTDANGAANDFSDDGCGTDGTVGGLCSVTFTSPTAGTVTGNASGDVTVGGVPLTRQTDGAAGNSDAAVKRFVDAQISIAEDDVNEIGQPHTFTVTFLQDDGLAAGAPGGDGADGFGPVPDDTPVTVVLSGSPANVVDECAAPGTVDGACKVTFTSNVAGIVTGNATGEVTIDTETLVRTTGTNAENPDAVKRFVDAYITIAPNDLNGVTEPHTFTVSVFQDDGLLAGAQGGDAVSGFGPAQNANVAVDLIAAGGASPIVSDNTCDDGPVAVGCSVTFTSNTAGTVTGHASAGIGVGGLILGRITDGVAPNSADAVKTFWSGSVSITKDVGFGPFTTAATVCFQLDRTDGGALILDPSTAQEQCHDFAAGSSVSFTYAWLGLAPGTYSVTETSVSPPYAVMAPNPITGIVVDAAHRDVNVGTVTNPLPPGDLCITKFNPDGSLWAGVNVTFEIYSDGVLVTSVVIPGQGNPVCIELPEGTYLVREIVPAGFTVLPSAEQTVTVVADQTTNVTFTNVPQQVLEGCTPGFWRNQGLPAFDNPGDALPIALGNALPAANPPTANADPVWSGSLFRDVFGLSSAQMSAVGLNPNLTMIQAINLGGGGFKALARHGAAGLLNAEAVNFEFDILQVYDAVRNPIINNNSGAAGANANLLGAANDRTHQSCPTS